MNAQKRTTVIIPSLNPDEKLMKVIKGLEEIGFDDIIVINDGSRAENLCNFPDVGEHPSCTVLTHPQNRGKGAAMKTAFEYFLKNREGREGVVAVDGDNQHLPKDVLACCEKMLETGDLVLGVRDFSLPGIPLRSRFGNKTTSLVFRLAMGIKLSDTQTGLRAFPRAILGDMLEIAGERFEYETNMLLELKERGIDFVEQKIETVYIEENKTSHFRPIVDSIKIYSLILKFLLSSLVSFSIDNAVYFVLHLVLGHSLNLLCFAGARVISSLTNFILNKKTVFKNKGDVKITLLKYYALAIPMLLISYFGVEAIVGIADLSLSEVASSAFATAVKITVEFILFLISFRIQREWVFSSKKK